ncbi:MAG: hypothetical protein NTY68_00135 [Candidatus Micrarchaeota archaeon]|nr:hypothetical protein [Candidatus Micrarchaeota archaeon]
METTKPKQRATLSIDDRINRIFDSKTDADRINAVKDLVDTEKPAPKYAKNPYTKKYSLANEQNILRFNNEKGGIVANVMSVLRNMDEKEAENIRRLFSEYFNANGATMESMRKISSVCASAYTISGGRDISAYDMYHYSPGPAGSRLAGITTPMPSHADSVRIPELKPRKVEQPKAPNAVILSNPEEAVKTFGQVFDALTTSKDKIVKELGNEKKAPRTIEAYKKANEAYLSLVSSVNDKNNPAEIETLASKVENFYKSIGNYATASYGEFVSAKGAGGAATAEKVIDWAVPIIIIGGSLILRFKGPKEKAIEIAERLGSKAAIEIYEGLAKLKYPKLAQVAVRFGAKATIATGLGISEYIFDESVYSSRKKQIALISQMKEDLNKVKGQKASMESTLPYEYRAKLNAVEDDIGKGLSSIEKRIGKGDSSPSIASDILKYNALIMATWVVLASGPLAMKLAEKGAEKGENALNKPEAVKALENQLNQAESRLKELVGTKKPNAAAIKKAKDEVTRLKSQIAGQGKKTEEAAEDIIQKSGKAKLDNAINALNKAIEDKNPAKIKAAKASLEKLTGKSEVNVDELLKTANKILKKSKI